VKQVSAVDKLKGRVTLPGDKSISHRLLILNAMSEGISEIENICLGDDVKSTAKCLTALGVRISFDGTDAVVEGVGLHGFIPPQGILDAGNSGTTMRLMAGLLAGQPFESTVDGDASLRNRPMGRIIKPLVEMGASVKALRADDKPPIVIKGGKLHGIYHRPPVASAQVKSCVLIAGVLADGLTTVSEVYPTRNHTELLLSSMGAEIAIDNQDVSINGLGDKALQPLSMRVPGDISAASYFMVAGSIHDNAYLTIPDCGVNPTRRRIIDLLCGIGGDVKLANTRKSGPEQVADIIVQTPSSPLASFELAGRTTADLIDEVPILAVLATQCNGQSTIRDASELRVKESDRIRSVVNGLKVMGADVQELEDGMIIKGPSKLRGAIIDTYGDHRIAMAFSIAGLIADGTTTILDAQCVSISYPGFYRILESLAC